MKRLGIDWNVHTKTDFEPSLRRFRRYLEDNGFRESTIEGYVDNVGRYLKFAGTDKTSEKDRITFRDESHNSKLSRSTLNQYGYAIKAYHSMLGEDISYRQLNPHNHIPYYYLDFITLQNESVTYTTLQSKSYARCNQYPSPLV